MPHVYEEEDYRKDSLLYVLGDKLPLFNDLDPDELYRVVPRYARELAKLGVEVDLGTDDIRPFIVSAMRDGHFGGRMGHSRLRREVNFMRIVAQGAHLTDDEVRKAVLAAHTATLALRQGNLNEDLKEPSPAQ